LRSRIFTARQPDARVTLREIAELGHDISLAYADAVNAALRETSLTASDLAAVAAHGQTLFHDPPLTIQWLDPALLAAAVGCPVVSDFRRADCAAGGQGAPLVPFADYILFRDLRESRVLLNIGGIANLTYIPAGAGIDDLVAFDTGPGNCISDHICRIHDPCGRGFDPDGQQAATGAADREIIDRVKSAPYFRARPPKSTDVPTMLSLFDQGRHDSGRTLRPADLLATACLLTAETIADAAAAYLPGPVDRWVASGGGVRNRHLMRLLAERMPNLMTVDEFGIPSEAKEAMAFAILGAATLDQEPANVPSATGATRRVVLGTVTPKP
jgi:anhydro-N-acetylmuramic acid kinase